MNTKLNFALAIKIEPDMESFGRAQDHASLNKKAPPKQGQEILRLIALL